MAKVPVMLTIAGSDSGGGAGIQADLKACLASSKGTVFGASIITAITAQNTKGVRAIHYVPSQFIDAQIEAVIDDFQEAGNQLVVKTGMMGSAEIIETVARNLIKYNVKCVVVDPVMVSTSGSSLLDPSSLDALVSKLFPLATLITPNLPEASKILQRQINSLDEMRRAAMDIHTISKANAVLIKGGHSVDSAHDLHKADFIVDILYDGKTWEAFTSKRVDTKNLHGTGCTLAATIATQMAMGKDLITAIKDAKVYLDQVLARPIQVGTGNGPLNHGAPLL